MIRAFKLLRLRRDGSLGPLFINRRQRIPQGVWLDAEPHRTKGFAFRPGWHCCRIPHAPHLSEKGRVWCEVEIEDYQLLERPESQGGAWYLAQRMRLLREIHVYYDACVVLNEDRRLNTAAYDTIHWLPKEQEVKVPRSVESVKQYDSDGYLSFQGSPWMPVRFTGHNLQAVEAVKDGDFLSDGYAKLVDLPLKNVEAEGSIEHIKPKDAK